MFCTMLYIGAHCMIQCVPIPFRQVGEYCSGSKQKTKNFRNIFMHARHYDRAIKIIYSAL